MSQTMKTDQLEQLRNEVITSGHVSATSLYVESAKGAVIRDVEGREYIDQEQFTIIAEIRGLGAMLGLELVKGPNKEPATEESKKLVSECLKMGLVILACGSYGNILRILAPLVISDAQLEKGLAILEMGLRNISE